jgi:glycosyltransferase involved in cell wall biosynthesis
MRRDVGAILRDATDVLIAAAREEAQPLSVLEAQWLGVPVLASDIAAHREVLPRPDTALFPLDDAAALARTLGAVAAERPRWRAAAASWQAAAHARHDMPRYVRSFQALYNELLLDAARARDEGLARATAHVARAVLRTT